MKIDLHKINFYEYFKEYHEEAIKNAPSANKIFKTLDYLGVENNKAILRVNSTALIIKIDINEFILKISESRPYWHKCANCEYYIPDLEYDCEVEGKCDLDVAMDHEDLKDMVSSDFGCNEFKIKGIK